MSGSSVIFGLGTEIHASVDPVSQVPEREFDPLLCRAELEFREVFYPMGFALEIKTNDRAVLAAARESWGDWSERYSAPPMRLTVNVMDDGASEYPPTPTARSYGHLFSMVANANNQMICDLKAGIAFTCFSRVALHNSNFFRYHFLEAIAYTMLGALHATPLHGACVSRNGHGMLFCGNSGAGKSTLAYACARQGWTYTSDDATYLLRGTLPRVIGNSRQVRFRPHALTLFPEIGDRALTPRAEGKPSIEVPTDELPGLITSDEATIGNIIFLNRQPSARAELIPLSYASILTYFKEALFPDIEVHALQMASLEALATADAYELRYEDLDSAIACLEGLSDAADLLNSTGRRDLSE